jgi:DsbC/DsbD-like thiol-disulfide interchange protein
MRWPALFLLAFFGMVSVVAAKPPVDVVRAELVADSTGVAAGQTFTVGLHLHIAPGWHVYWTNPGDIGAPTELSLTLPKGFTAGELQFPVPERLEEADNAVVFGYENDVLLTTTITAPADLGGTTAVPIAALANWCVCSRDECVLGHAKLDLKLPVGPTVADHADLFAAWGARRAEKPSAAFVSFDATWDAAGGIATLKIRWKGAGPPANLHWLPGASDDLAVKEKSIGSEGDVTTVVLSIEPVKGIAQKSSTISGLLSYHEENQPPRGVAVTVDRGTLRLVN